MLFIRAWESTVDRVSDSDSRLRLLSFSDSRFPTLSPSDTRLLRSYKFSNSKKSRKSEIKFGSRESVIFHRLPTADSLPSKIHRLPTPTPKPCYLLNFCIGFQYKIQLEFAFNTFCFSIIFQYLGWK